MVVISAILVPTLCVGTRVLAMYMFVKEAASFEAEKKHC